MEVADNRIRQSEGHIYIAIDLKSFYASVECRERKLDPMTTHLVVADISRTEKTICLAVSPSLKAYGIPGRARLFEVVQKVKLLNAERLNKAPVKHFTGKSSDAGVLVEQPSLALDYIAAPPRMALYMKYSTQIYNIYLKYVAPEDIHVYSIDEVFMDVTAYLETYGLTPRGLAVQMIRDVQESIGIAATAGIGTNLYLCKIALDIMAKRVPPDENGVRIAELDEMAYRRMLWAHRPLTDFWRVGQGYAKKLEACGLMTMGDIAHCSVGSPSDFYNEKLLYNMFGVNAELLIDHAWGWEPCTIADVKAYKPESSSTGSGQVLQYPYSFEKARMVVREMTELLVLGLVDKKLVTDQLVLTVGYDIENLSRPEIGSSYKGPVTTDRYGRKVPKHAHGTAHTGRMTSSTQLIMDAVLELYDSIVNPKLFIRRIYVTANHVTDEVAVEKEENYKQLDLFSYFELETEAKHQEEVLAREKKLQHAMLDIKKKFGKNAILKGTDLEEGATTLERNDQIGGHKA